MFTDKNGEELKIGDYIIPDEGLELLITEEKYIEDLGEICLIATQVIHPNVFSILPQDNLSMRWEKIDEADNAFTPSPQSIEPTIIDEYGAVNIPADPEPYKTNEEADKESIAKGRISGK